MRSRGFPSQRDRKSGIARVCEASRDLLSRSENEENGKQAPIARLFSIFSSLVGSMPDHIVRVE